MIKPGDKLISKDGKVTGTAVYSTFGISVSGRIALYDGSYAHFQTLGAPAAEVSEEWRKIGEGECG